MPNVDLKPFKRPSMWRRMSLANWRAPTDPQVYGRMELDMTKALAYAEATSEATGVRITPTHLVARAVAGALRRHPGNNVMIRWNRVYERETVDVFCQVAIPGKKDLSGAVIRDADTKDAASIAVELRERAARVREGSDELSKSRGVLNYIPAFFYRLVLGILTFFQYTLNLNLKVLGLPKDAFGSVMVTSIGSLGIPEGWAPLVPMSRVPIVVSVGALQDKPWVVDGAIEIRPVSVICAVFDHRIMDGLNAGRLAEEVQDYIRDPAAWEAAAGGVTEPSGTSLG